MWFAQQLPDPGLLVATLGTGGGLGGLWFVARLIWRFQRDVVDRYSERIDTLEGRVRTLEEKLEMSQDRLDQAQRQLIACATERGALRAIVRQHGIEWHPEDWEHRGRD